jgi:Tfp pilus assembly protein PilN
LNFQPDYYLANISLAIKPQAPSLHVSSLNLLPESFHTNKIKWGRVSAIPGMAVFAVAVTVLVMLITDTSSNIASVRNQLAVNSQILQGKQSEQMALTKEIKSLEDTLNKSKTSQDAGNSLLQLLMVKADETNQDLIAVVGNIPESISLNAVSLNRSTVDINGTATSETSVLSYARQLEQTGRFSQTVVSNINSNEGGEVSFSLTLMK